MNEGDWPGAVRESIHAVESVARQLDPNSSKYITSMPLKVLTEEERHCYILPSKMPFEKLYAYTSDVEGVRHSLMDNADIFSRTR